MEKEMPDNTETKISYDNEAYELDNNVQPAPIPLTADRVPSPQNGRGTLPRAQNGTSSSRAGVGVEEGGSKKETMYQGGSDHAQDEQQALRDREPIFICRWIVNRPKTWFAATLGCQLFFLVLTGILAAGGYDILPIVFDALPLDIRDDVDYLRGLAWDYRKDTDENIVEIGSAAEIVQTERSEIFDIVELIYNMKDGGNILTKANLELIQGVENAFTDNQNFKTKFCYTLDGANCTLPNSILRYFDGSKAMINPIFNDPSFSNIPAVLNEANTNDLTKVAFQSHLSVNAVINSTYASMSATKSSLVIGWPLQGYSNTSDRESEQEKDLKDFLKNEIDDIGAEYYSSGVGDMEFLYSSNQLIGLFISSQVITDFAKIVGSFIFIFVFMVIQTGSFWTTGFAIGSILTGFCGANLIYRVILDFRYFGIFHILAVFIILGIGADDVFVFFDTWKETGHHNYKSLAHRFSDCYRKASTAMLFTSLTTAVAFFVSATSPFLAVYSFGVFSGILVCVNYCTVITFFPSVVIVYHLYFEKYKCCCCCPRESSIDDSNVHTNTSQQNKEKKKNPIVRFFGTYYFKAITHKVARWFILAAYAIILAVMIYWCTQLQVNEEQTEFLKDDTLTGRYILVRSERFSSLSDGANTQVYLIWGLKEQSRSGCHHTNATCTGSTVWDDNFNLNSYTAQNQLKDLCGSMINMTDEMVENLHIKRNLVTNDPEVLCFIDDLADFYQGRNYNFPLNETDIETLMTNNPLIYSSSLSPSIQSTRYFEVGTSFFLFNGFDSGPNANMRSYSAQLGEAKMSGSIEKQFPDYSYWYGTRLRYAAIVVNLTVNARELGYPKGLPIRDEWEDWMTTTVAGLSAPLQGGFQTTPAFGLGATGFNLWHWLKVQKKLVSSAVVGIAVGLCVALPILIIATHNLVVGLCATLMIGLITLSVVGVIPAAGWKLGILESLNLVLVVGLAVDYVVHLAEGYSRSTAKDRLGRTKDMLEEVGISVLSGAITTLGASIFLLPAKIIFFYQFGIFMFSTIGLSLLYSLGLFATLMAIIGPQGSTGSIKGCTDKCRCCKSGSADLSA